MVILGIPYFYFILYFKILKLTHLIAIVSFSVCMTVGMGVQVQTPKEDVHCPALSLSALSL